MNYFNGNYKSVEMFKVNQFTITVKFSGISMAFKQNLKVNYICTKNLS